MEQNLWDGQLGGVVRPPRPPPGYGPGVIDLKESFIQSQRYDGITHTVIDLKESLIQSQRYEGITHTVIDLKESLMQSHRFEGITHTESEI